MRFISICGVEEEVPIARIRSHLLKHHILLYCWLRFQQPSMSQNIYNSFFNIHKGIYTFFSNSFTIPIVWPSLHQTPLLGSHEIKIRSKNSIKNRHVPMHYSLTVGGGINLLWTTLMLMLNIIRHFTLFGCVRFEIRTLVPFR